MKAAAATTGGVTSATFAAVTKVLPATGFEFRRS